MSKAAELAALIGSQSALSNRNLVINGAFQVAQRATSVTGVTGDGYQAVDRWQNQSGSLGTFTMSQSTTAPDGFAFSHKYDCTTADASPAAGDFLIFQHRIEGQNLQHLQYGTSGAKSITLSFYVRSNKTGTYIAELSHGDANSKNQQSYTINSADTWEKKTLTYVGQTTDAIDNNNGIGMFIQFWLGAGSTWSSGTLNPNVWADTTAANRAAGQVNLADSTSNEWYITGIQLEVGEQATPFEHRSFADELLRCQRYFTIVCGNDDNTFTNSHAWSSQEVIGHLGFGKVELRTNPTMSKSDNTHFQIRSGGTSETSDSVGFIQSNKLGHCRVEFSGSGGLTQGRGAWVKLNTTSGYIHADAEL